MAFCSLSYRNYGAALRFVPEPRNRPQGIRARETRADRLRCPLFYIFPLSARFSHIVANSIASAMLPFSVLRITRSRDFSVGLVS